jgi:hypothetical protein
MAATAAKRGMKDERIIGRRCARSRLVAARRSRQFSRKSDAERWEREQRHRLETGRQLAPKSSHTLAQLITAFQTSRERGNPHTIDTDNNTLALLPKSLVRRPLSSVQADDIRDHTSAMIHAQFSPSTHMFSAKDSGATSPGDWLPPSRELGIPATSSEMTDPPAHTTIRSNSGMSL